MNEQRQENLGQTSPEAQIEYNKVRANEFLNLRSRFYKRFPINHNCDEAFEDAVFREFDDCQQAMLYIKTVLEAVITRPAELAVDWKEFLVSNFINKQIERLRK